MVLSSEILEQIERYASAFMTIGEIAILINVDNKVFRAMVLTPGSVVAEAYWRGKLTSKFLIQESIASLAKMGSPQAQKDITQFISYQQKSER